MRWLGHAALAFLAYAAVILAVIVAGFLGAAVGIWASILWAILLLAAVVLYARRRRRRPQPNS